MKEPAPHDRVYVRGGRTSERGYLVTGDKGEVLVKLDRPSQELLYPYTEGEWEKESVEAPLTRMQVGHIAFKADCALCLYLRMHKESRRDWETMTVPQRIEWSEKGPREKLHREERQRLFKAIKNLFHEDSR